MDKNNVSEVQNQEAVDKNKNFRLLGSIQELIRRQRFRFRV